MGSSIITLGSGNRIAIKHKELLWEKLTKFGLSITSTNY